MFRPGRTTTRQRLMSLRSLIWILALALGAATVWKFRDADFLRGNAEVAKPRPIEFDNGTVRQYKAPEPAAPGTPLPPGSMRKCHRNDAKAGEVIYTDQPCPKGYREREVGAGTVNVVTDPGARAAAAAKAAASGAQNRLRDALDINADERLRERMMERAEGAR